MRMFKRLLCLLMAWMLLLSMAGCASSEGRKDRDDDDDEREEEREDEDKDEEGEGDIVQGEVSYEIVLRDNSIRNDNGDVLASVTYEQVVLQGSSPEIEAINELIEEDCNDFLENSSAHYYTPEELEETLEINGMDYGSLFNDAGATVTHNANGIFSIRISADWFMGGVYNADAYGLTYDVRTGREATIDGLLGLSEEDALATLNDVAYDYLVEYYGEALFCDPMEILSQYSLEDYLFYVENGELVVTFYTYEFAPGAAGAATVHTGLMIGE